MNPKYINAVLWLAFILAMLASINHIAWTFGTVEQPGREWLGWVPAVAVDASLAALAYAIQQRRKAKRQAGWLWAGVAFFAIISALANLYHALAVETGGIATLSAITAVDALQFAKALLLSATLPALVIYLSEIISSDDAAAAKASEAAAERERAKAEREQRRADLLAEREAAEAKRLLLEAERQPEQPQLLPAVSEPERIACPICGKEYSRNGLNAHMKVHANGVPVSGKVG